MGGGRGGEGMSAEFLFPPLRVASKISQSGRGSLLGTNKVIGLNCKYVFRLLASLWDMTHTHACARARTGSIFADAHTTLTLQSQKNVKPPSSRTEVLFI